MSTIPASRSAAESLDRERAPAKPRAHSAADEFPWWGTLLLGTFLMGLGVVLLYFVIALWPAVQSAAAGETERPIQWFGWSYTPTPDAALLILVVLVSALGSFVHATVSFTDYVGNRQLTRSWAWWYVLRVFVGSALAVLVYFALRGGFFGANAASEAVNPYGIAAVSGLVGLFSKQATDKLREIFDTAFRVGPGYGDDARSDSITNPPPSLEASEPARLKAGDLEVTLVGSGFVAGSTVRVTQVGGDDVPREVVVQGPQRLRVTLDADDVAGPGVLLFTVVNPEPGGGSSRVLPVWVDAADAAVPEPPAPAEPQDVE